MDRKKNSLILTAVLIAAVCAFGATSAQAVQIVFEGVAGQNPPVDFIVPVGDNYEEGGFNFSNPNSGASIVSVGAGLNPTGSDYYSWESAGTFNPIKLTSKSDPRFNLASLDVGAIFLAIPVSFDITGFLSGGGTVVEQVDSVGAFENRDLNWTDLTHVEFQWVSGGFGAIDNLIVSSVQSPVPEPTTMLLLGSGLIGLAAFRRKLKKI